MSLGRPCLAMVAALLLTACPPGGVASTAETSQTDTVLDTTSSPEVTTEACEVGVEGCPCTGGGACDSGLMCVDKLCVPISGMTESTSVDPSTETGTSALDMGDGSTDGTTEPPPVECTSKGDNLESVECVAIDPSRPFCENDLCVGCVGLAPEACDQGTVGERPICLPSGACGECSSLDALGAGECTVVAPHCNLETNACEGCFEHSECPETACEIKTRKCFPKDKKIYVRQYSDNLECSEQPGVGGHPDLPYCDLETAILGVQDGGASSGYTFHVLGNDDAEGDPGPVVIPPTDSPVAYAFTHELGSLVDKHTRLKGTGPMIVVPQNVTLYLVNFGLIPDEGIGDSSTGITCNNGAVWLDDSRILYARGPGIRADNCDIHMRRSAASLGFTEGIDLTNASLFMVNSFVGQNENIKDRGGGGLHLRDGATVDILYSTIADNSNEPAKGLGDSIHCDNPASIKIRNSILARRPTGANSSIACVGSKIEIVTSSIDYNLMPPDIDKDNFKGAAEDIIDTLVFEMLSGTFRIDEGMEVQAKDRLFKAIWRPGDPHFDASWDPRPAKDGAVDYAGADVLAN